ncbi:hypothetical protein [Streptomyces sp. NPDC002845]
MSDTHTTHPPASDTQEATGHGKHRGPVSVQDSEAPPRGRHRKPSSGQNQQHQLTQQTEQAA